MDGAGGEQLLRYSVPPAKQPRQREAARQGLSWRSRRPRLPAPLAKRDIKAGFKLVGVRAGDIWVFAAGFARADLGLGADAAVLYLALVFGSMGAPGE